MEAPPPPPAVLAEFTSPDALLRITAMLTEAPLSVGDAFGFAAHPACGAVASFVGTTRDSHGGRPVARLEYEAHGSMALAHMLRLARQAAERAGAGAVQLRRVYVAHRLGVVPVGEASIIITASSPHRPAALEAVAWLIDAVKASVPVWKREVYADDGSAVWKANSECCWGGGGGGGSGGGGGDGGAAAVATVTAPVEAAGPVGAAACASQAHQ